MSARIVLALNLYCVVAAFPAPASCGAAASAKGDAENAATHDSAASDDAGADGDAAETAGEALTIDDVMRYAMTQHLCKKVAKKEATAEEQERLVSLFETLGTLEPPKGSAESWKAKTDALVAAARDVAEGKPSHSQLMKAANCAACHKEHRP